MCLSEELTEYQKLAADNQGLVSQVLRNEWWREDVRSLGWEEGTSIGLLALVQAAHKYDPCKSRFCTYAYTCIRNALLAEAFSCLGVIRIPRWLAQLRQDDPRRMRAELLRHTISLRPLGQTSHEDFLWAPEDDGLPAPTFPQLQRAIRRLPPRERKLVREVVMRGKGLRKVAARLALSRQRASQLIRRALLLLKQELSPLPAEPQCPGRRKARDEG